MSHSPLRMFKRFHDKCVLVSGQGPVLEIAKKYPGIVTVFQSSPFDVRNGLCQQFSSNLRSQLITFNLQSNSVRTQLSLNTSCSVWDLRRLSVLTC